MDHFVGLRSTGTRPRRGQTGSEDQAFLGSNIMRVQQSSRSFALCVEDGGMEPICPRHRECQGHVRRHPASESTPGESSPDDTFRRARHGEAPEEVQRDACAPRRCFVRLDRAPRFSATSSNAQIRFPWFATASIVIAGRDSSSVFLDVGTAYRTEGAGWPVSVPGTAPCGLSAVSGNRSRWPACSLAVVAFPLRGLRADGTAFRRPSGTTRPSDSSRLVVISSLVPR